LLLTQIISHLHLSVQDVFQIVAAKNIFFVSAFSALAIRRRDASTILSDISTIDSSVRALTSAVNGYNGGIFGAIPIENAESTLDKSINQGTSDAQAASQVSSTDSNSIIAAVQNLTRDIEASIQALEAKKLPFAAAGLTSTVQNDLITLKSDTDSFANALIAIASADTTDQAQAKKATIDNDFQGAINNVAN